MTPTPIKVVVVDDQAPFRAAAAGGGLALA